MPIARIIYLEPDVYRDRRRPDPRRAGGGPPGRYVGSEGAWQPGPVTTSATATTARRIVAADVRPGRHPGDAAGRLRLLEQLDDRQVGRHARLGAGVLADDRRRRAVVDRDRDPPGSDRAGRRRRWRRGERVLPAGLFFGLNITLFFTAINRTSIAHAEFITALSPLVLVPLGAVFFHEKPDRRALLWGLLTVLGLAIVLFLGGSQGGASISGDALVVVVVGTWVGYLLTGRRARAHRRRRRLHVDDDADRRAHRGPRRHRPRRRRHVAAVGQGLGGGRCCCRCSPGCSATGSSPSPSARSTWPRSGSSRSPSRRSPCAGASSSSARRSGLPRCRA